MSDFIKSLIDEAHIDYLNGLYDECIRKLKSIKLRLTDKNMFDEFNNEEQTIDSSYQKKENEARHTAPDEINYINMVREAKKWKSERYMSYYTRKIVRIE